jgi:hypothetical protein
MVALERPIAVRVGYCYARFGAQIKGRFWLLAAGRITSGVAASYGDTWSNKNRRKCERHFDDALYGNFAAAFCT